jgi:hypothetical protein
MRHNLENHLRTGKKIRLERRYPSNPRLNGYLLDVSDVLGLMHCFDDFQPDGYTVFRVNDVADVRSGKYERHWDRMLAGEDLLDGLELDLRFDLTSMQSAIESIAREYGRLIIECEDQDEDVEDFYIGQVVSIGGDTVQFDHFDGLGQWEESAASVPLEEITLLQFETPYIHRFWKYVSGTAPNTTSH